jgi:hypothetical protein
MAQHLHIFFGGDLVTSSENLFKDIETIPTFRIVADRSLACDVLKTEAQKTVDCASMHGSLGGLEHLMDGGTSSPEARN